MALAVIKRNTSNMAALSNMQNVNISVGVKYDCASHRKCGLIFMGRPRKMSHNHPTRTETSNQSVSVFLSLKFKFNHTSLSIAITTMNVSDYFFMPLTELVFRGLKDENN